jgi:hypothetical protein
MLLLSACSKLSQLQCSVVYFEQDALPCGTPLNTMFQRKFKPFVLYLLVFLSFKIAAIHFLKNIFNQLHMMLVYSTASCLGLGKMSFKMTSIGTNSMLSVNPISLIAV